MPHAKDTNKKCYCKIQDKFCGIMQVIDEQIYGYCSLTEYVCKQPCTIIEQLKKKLSK